MRNLEKYQKSQKQLIKTLCLYRQRLIHLQRLLVERQQEIKEKDRLIAQLTNKYDTKIQILKQRLSDFEVTQRQTQLKWQQMKIQTVKMKECQTIELELNLENIVNAYKISMGQRIPLIVCPMEEPCVDQKYEKQQGQQEQTSEPSDMQILVEFI